MRETQLTNGQAAKIIWLLTWRASFGIGITDGVLFKVVQATGKALEASPGAIVLNYFVLAAISGVIWWFIVMHMAIKKRYRGFRLAVLVQADAPRSLDEPFTPQLPLAPPTRV